MRRRAHFVNAVLALGALGALGCAGMEIRYQPVAAVAPASTARVALKVFDARGEKHPNVRPNQVGLKRTAVGIPYQVVRMLTRG